MNTDHMINLGGILIMAAIAVIGMVVSRRQKVDANIIPGTASNQDLRAHEIKTRNDVKDLHNKIERVQSEVKSEIKSVAIDVGRVSAQNEIQSQRLVQMDSKLDRLIERKSNT